ncbi:MAG: FecR domain-containing protein [Planctomycetota bacterium]|jgi:ferric-dicitrate binding protein FerR (iron transport regulator)|nr:FecR domain-containing protein [Planctomycetota bacterium]
MKRLEALYERLIDGALTTAEADELSELLADVDVRRAWAALIAIDGALLETYLGDSSKAVPVLASTGTGVHPRAPRKRSARQPGHRRQPAPRRRAIHPAVIGLLLVATLGLIGGLVAMQSRDQTRPVLVDPTPSTARLLATLLEGAPDAVVRPGSDLDAGAWVHGPARIALRDGSLIQLQAGCRWQLQADNRQWVALGSMAIVAQPQRPELPMTIATPHAEMRVVGTRFRVTVEAAASSLAVDEGQVAWQLPGGAVDLVQAGGERRSDAMPSGQSALGAPEPGSVEAIEVLWSADQAVLSGVTEIGLDAPWFGRAVADGLRPAINTETDVGQPYHEIRVRYDRQGVVIPLNQIRSLEIDLSAKRACDIALVLVVVNSLGEWVTNLEAVAPVPEALRSHLEIPMSAFVDSRGGRDPLATVQIWHLGVGPAELDAITVHGLRINGVKAANLP